MDSVSLQDGGAGSPLLRSSFPFRFPDEWKEARGKVRAALTPSPSPAARERGVLVSGLGIVDRHRYRIATATLTPASTPLVEAAGGRGKVRAALPPSSPAARERKGARGKVRAPTPGAAGCPHPQPRSRAAGRPHPQPRSRAAGAG